MERGRDENRDGGKGQLCQELIEGNASKKRKKKRFPFLTHLEIKSSN